MTFYELPVRGDASSTVNDILKGWLEKGEVDAVLAMQETPSGKSAFPAMISEPGKMNTNVFAPLLPVSTATIVSRLTKRRGFNNPVVVVLRSCELRALVELVKLKQADMDNIITMAVDCPGTFSINTYSSYPGKGTPTEGILNGGDSAKYMRSACLNCKDPVASNADINIGLFGMDHAKMLMIESSTDSGSSLLEGIGLKEMKDLKKREKGVEAVREEKKKNRDAFKSEKMEIEGVDRMLEFFDTCINCHNCMGACPICYCKECLFESSVFDLEADKYMARSKGKGAFKTPTDSLLFHVTRFNHMILSCVQCGLCEQACPSNIPLMDIITKVADNAQSEFEYHPGTDPEEPVPMVVYREEEFQDVGE